MDTDLEEETIKARISGYKRKSSRGARNTKITLVVPESLAEELRIIANTTRHPTNDVCNNFLEQYAEENAEIVRKYKQYMEDLGA